MKPQPNRAQQLGQIAAAVVASAAAAQPRHDGDCQMAQHTYVHPGNPGVYPHGSRGQGFAVDAVGINGRRLLIRDDPDGLYVGGVLLTTELASELLGELAILVTDRARRERSAVDRG